MFSWTNMVQQQHDCEYGIMANKHGSSMKKNSSKHKHNGEDNKLYMSIEKRVEAYLVEKIEEE